MNDLHPQERALLDLARHSHEPSEADRRRIRTALLAQLGVGTGLGMATAAGTSTAAAGTAGILATTGAGASVTVAAVKVAAVIALAGTLAGGGFVAYRASRPSHARVAVRVPAMERTTRFKAEAPAPVVAPVVAPVLDRSAGDLVAGSAAEPSRIREEQVMRQSPSVRSPSSTLSPPPAPRALPEARGLVAPIAAPTTASTIEAETRVVRAAVAALHAGDPARALVLFDEHARAYPTGVLAEERRAERVMALCELGRVTEARTAARAFLHEHPQSPLSARVRASCGPRSNP